MDLLALAGLNAAVIPHFDNAEGGNYDTSCCYIGRRRLDELIAQLPEGYSVLGIDEHTAAVVDLEAGALEVIGKGSVHWTSGEINLAFVAGQVIPLSELGTGVRAQITTSPATNPDSIEELAHQAEIGGPTGLAAIARLATLASQGSESHIEPSPLIDALV